MEPPRPASKIVSFQPRPVDLMRSIRRAADDSGNVAFGAHARQRMVQRGISDAQAIAVLKQGDISGDIEQGNGPGEWKCKVIAPVKGSRDVGVVLVTALNARLFVKTVEWEDR